MRRKREEGNDHPHGFIPILKPSAPRMTAWLSFGVSLEKVVQDVEQGPRTSSKGVSGLEESLKGVPSANT